MDVDRNRFLGGFAVFITALIINAYWSVLSLRNPGTDYGTYLIVGGSMAGVGLLIMVSSSVNRRR
jgi:hypothetical protein